MARFERARYLGAFLPLPAYFGLVTVLYGVLTWVFDDAGNHRHATLSNLVLHVVLGSLYGAAITGVVAFQRRRFGGSTLQVATAKAIRAGVAPADADPAAWEPLLERRLRTLRRSRWLSPLLMAPIAAFGVVGWVLVPSAGIAALWLIVFSLGLVAVAEFQVARYIPRARAVLEQLRTGEFHAPSPSVPQAKMKRPRAVAIALILCLIGAGAAAGQLLIFLLTPARLSVAINQMHAKNHVSLAQVEQLAGVAVAILIAYWCLLLFALALFGSLAYAGRNWARGWLVPVVLLSLIELLSKQPLALAIPIATVAAVVLLYLPRSTAWINGRRRARAASRKGPR